MRLLTWNVNGLRAYLRRKGQLLGAALDALGADIICLQETKLTKGELDSSLAIADGWDSFFCCTHGKSGYSGVATFCRSANVPQAAEEGVSGILQPGSPELLPEVLDRFSRDELRVLDAEGRCVVTDHGAFVLFNVYGPAIAGDDKAEARFAFKLAFYEVLHLRMASLRAQGRNVILVGDLNISPAPEDSCCSGTGEDLQAFKRRKDRVWLNSLLAADEPFVDAFRRFHPDRKEAFTCWNQASGARVNNWGSRIDLILIADGLSPEQQGLKEHLVHSDIEPSWQGSDHAPVWADLGPGALLCHAKTLPALASRNLFTGKQQSMLGFLRKASSGEQAPAAPAQPPASSACAAAPRPPAKPLLPANGTSAKAPRPASAAGGKRKRAAGTQQRSMRSFLPRSAPAGPPAEPPAASAASSASALVCSSSSAPCTNSHPVSSVLQPGGASHHQQQQQPSAGQAQSSLAAAFEADLEAELTAEASLSAAGSAAPPGQTQSQFAAAFDADLEAELTTQVSASGPASAAGSEASLPAETGADSKEDAAAAWKRIQQRMQPPPCFGHGEPCVIRQTKKNCPNKGRLFYVCARPDGPKPHGRCDHFVWVGKRTAKG